MLDRWLIAEALSGLSLEHRTVISAAYYEGRSVADISARLHIPEGTVKSRLHYGLRTLKLILQEKGVTAAVTAPCRIGTAAGTPPTCWAHSRRPSGGSSRSTWPAARACQAAVSELAGLPGLLAQVSPEDAALLAAAPAISWRTGRRAGCCPR